MKALIHGAINRSNYGDFLFAAIFSSALKERGIDVEYYCHPKYGISDFFARHLGYTPDRKHYKKTMESCDVLVYISGGYMLSHKKLLVEYFHTKRFLPPAEYFMKSGKPIYIMGIGAGPFYKGPFARIAKELLQYASAVTFRNEESREYSASLGITREIPVTADTALVIRDYLDSNVAGIPEFEIEPGKKMLLFHTDCTAELKNKWKQIAVPAAQKFLDSHNEYRLYLASDGLAPTYEEYAPLFSQYSPQVLRYDDPWLLTMRIRRADMILTTKLHVGILGTTFGCSVVSFPWHQKTARYYKQIGEQDRCIMLTDADEKTVLDQMERFEGKSVTVPEELINNARKNIELLPG